MVIFFIPEPLLPIYIALTPYSLELNKPFQPLSSRRNAAIMGLICRLLAGEGRGNLQICCPQFCNVNQLPRRSHRLHSWDPASTYVLLILAILRL